MSKAKTYFSFTNYQHYYRILAYFYNRRLSKYDVYGNKADFVLEYHHVKPVSIYGAEHNLQIAVPGRVHAKLHWHLWQHYLEHGKTEEAKKMEYAWKTLDEKYTTSPLDSKLIPWSDSLKKTYYYLMKNYSI